VSPCDQQPPLTWNAFHMVIRWRDWIYRGRAGAHVWSRRWWGQMDTAVDKALIILESLDNSKTGSTLAEVAEKVELPKPTVHRLLSTLVNRGFVARTPWNGYAVGRKVIALGAAAAEKDTLILAARPTLWTLAELCEETVQLGVLMGDQLLFVERIEPENQAVRIGRMPSPLAELHTSGMGKAILAASTDEFVGQYLKAGLERFTDKTVTDPTLFRQEIEEIREAGFAVSNEERYDGVFAVGAAILNREGQPIAAVSIAAPAHRVYGARRQLLEKEVVRAAAEVSQMIGNSLNL
jgi:IclR family transcriptional regulator, acetate operon repressor